MNNTTKITLIVLVTLLILLGSLAAFTGGPVQSLEGAEDIPVKPNINYNMEWGGTEVDRVPMQGGVGIAFSDRYQLENGVGIMEGLLFINMTDTGPTDVRSVRVFILSPDGNSTKVVMQTGAGGKAVNNVSGYKLSDQITDAFTSTKTGENIIVRPDPDDFVDIITNSDGGVDYDIDDMPYPELLVQYL